MIVYDVFRSVEAWLACGVLGVVVLAIVLACVIVGGRADRGMYGEDE